MQEREQPQRRWLDRPRNVSRLVYGLATVCALLAVIDLFLEKHVHYAFEKFPFFHAAFGFVAFTLIVLTGRPLRRLLMRKEDYYDR